MRRPYEIERRTRWRLLRTLDNALEMPLVILGFVWLLLLIYEFAIGSNSFFESINNFIWIIFVTDFLLKLTIAPDRISYLKSSWITIIALVVPALRVLRFARAMRILRAGRGIRGLRLVRILTSTNRGIASLERTMRRRGLGFVLVLTTIITFAGAAGMYSFENRVPQSPLKDFGNSLWWTAMVISTVGTDYWPKTPEGRMLCFLLTLYGFGIFGYIAAALASHFVQRDAEISGRLKQEEQILKELRDLKDELRRSS
jgi:voltage-gated potassium channel